MNNSEAENFYYAAGYREPVEEDTRIICSTCGTVFFTGVTNGGVNHAGYLSALQVACDHANAFGHEIDVWQDAFLQ